MNGINWKNVNLSDGYEREQNILDPYSFDVLLLEISCNLREITEETVKAEFEKQLQSKIESAREVFNDNLTNIVKKAREERED